MTDIRADGITIRAESGSRFGAPVSACIDRIEEPAFAGIRKFTGVHAFVTDLVAMHAKSELWRVEIHSVITFRHKVYAVLIPAACRRARLTAVFAICTL